MPGTPEWLYKGQTVGLSFQLEEFVVFTAVIHTGLYVIATHLPVHTGGMLFDIAIAFTKRRNAVLIFIAYDDRKFAILGDTGINEVVPDGFWDGEVEELGRYLTAGRPVDGICAIIARMGERLSQYFPGERDDENELSIEVTFDDFDDDEVEHIDHDDDYGNME